MPARTITFNTNAAQESRIKTAVEFYMDSNDPQNAPHTATPVQVRAQLRLVAMGAVKGWIAAQLQGKHHRDNQPETVDDIA